MDSKENLKNQRLEWMDVAKGIAIILMVVGNTTLPQYLLFFIISGG